MELIKNQMRSTDYGRLRPFFGVIIIWFFSGIISQAQDCSNPTQLCGETEALVETVDAISPFQFGCMDVQNVVFYDFFTNSNLLNAGNAFIDITNIMCNGLTEVDTLMAMIIQVAPEDPFDTLYPGPCDPLSWTQIGGCYEDTLAINIDTGPLDPSTLYYVVVGSNQPPGALDCGYEIGISGPAVDINACCDEQISLGESYDLTVTGGDDPPGYSWEPPSFLDDFLIDNPTTFPEETITYTAEGSIGGCQVSDVVTIFVGPPISVFNTFTPNGDGINETWEIPGMLDFKNAQVSVYTRWGQKVFNTVGYATEWDGTNGGKKLPSGTYYYVIELNSLDVDIPPLTGYVVIIH
jgi:gliding motility-associated-like protein